MRTTASRTPAVILVTMAVVATAAALAVLGGVLAVGPPVNRPASRLSVRLAASVRPTTTTKPAVIIVPPTTEPRTTLPPTTVPRTTVPRTTVPVRPTTVPRHPTTVPPTTGPPVTTPTTRVRTQPTTAQTTSTTSPSTTTTTSPGATTSTTSSTTTFPSSSAPPSLTVPASGGRNLELSQTAVAPGGAVEASGFGCPPDGPVAISVDGAREGVTTADGQGRFRSPVEAGNVVIGPHHVAASCGVVLTATLDVVLATSVQPGTSTLGVLLFFLLIGLALYRRAAVHR